MKPHQVLWTSKWVEIREIEFYTYLHEKFCNGKKVCILVIDSTKPNQVLGRYEYTPCHGDKTKLCSITGSVENKMSFEDCAVEEIREETGYSVEKESLIPLGVFRPYKGSDSVFCGYAVDVAGLTPGKIEGDGSAGEQGAYCNWITIVQAAMCDDPLIIAMYHRLRVVREVAENVTDQIRRECKTLIRS